MTKFNTDIRSLKQYENIFKSFLFKGISIVCTFAIFSISITYLSQKTYGVWLTIYSIIGWTAFFDLGLGNGLKNKLIKSLALNDHGEAQKIISTGYIILFSIVLLLITIFSILFFFINWNSILNLQNNKDLNINLLVYICFIFFSIKIFLDLINQILLAHQKVSYTNLISCISNVSVLTVIYFIFKFNLFSQQNRLYVMGIAISAIPVFVLTLYSIYLFLGPFKHLKPSLYFFNKKYINNIISSGAQFFIIQIAGLIIFSTDNIIIARLFSSSDVTIYNTAYKVFSILTFFWGIIITPYWAAFGEAFALADFIWIRKTMNNLLKIWLLFQLIIVLLLIFINFFYKAWLGESVNVPFNLSIFMALYIGLSTYCNVFAYFFNGIGKLKLQLLTSIFAATINIPLAIFLSKNIGMGLSGIILATSISLLLGAILVTLQYKKIVSKTAVGIWNS